MEELIPDIYENIFLRLDVRNLSRYKSVCKSWKSLISESRFINAHLNRSYNSNENGYKRIGEAVFLWSGDTGYSIVGSSYGLVCFSDGHELLVANPLTREVKPVPKPYGPVKEFPRANAREAYDRSSCWGFGYDSLRDDYKVVLGFMKGKDQTYFQVFSLKSNAWNVIGEVNYISNRFQLQVLCNGAIHWIMNPKRNLKKEVILSFDLSKEEFTEIPHPDKGRSYLTLGILEECLCIPVFVGNKKCVMKKDNENKSWEMVDNCKIKYKYIFNFFEVTNYSYLWDGYLWFIGNRKFKGGPRIMESLASPHLQAKIE